MWKVLQANLVWINGVVKNTNSKPN